MKFVRRLLIFGLMLVLTTIAVIACGNNQQGDRSGDSPVGVVRVGSKDFTEQYIIGELYALALEEAGLKVERRLNLGGTPVAHAGLLSGEIDLYPEYTGTGLLTVLKLKANSDPKAVYETVAQTYKNKFGLIWLDPAPMNNTQAIAMKKEDSDYFPIKTISDFVKFADQLVLLGPPEFEVREDGLPGLKAVYGDFQLKAYKAIDPGLRYQALSKDEGDAVVAFGTDGEILALDLVLLEDDKNLFPPYQVAPVVRQEVLEKNPQVREALNMLSAKLTHTVMQNLNNEVNSKQREPVAVAQEFFAKIKAH